MILAAFLLGGCAGTASDGPDLTAALAKGSWFGSSTGSGTAPAGPPIGLNDESRPTGYQDFGQADAPGSGSASAGPGLGMQADGQTFTLNFVDADLQAFVRTVFDEILKRNVIVDPALTGRVTVRTVAPVSRTAALDLVRNVLEMNGGSLTEAEGVFRVSLSGSGNGVGGRGDDVRVVPLRHLDAEQARGALQSVGADPSRLSALPETRVVILSGSVADLDRWQTLLATLDVDQMRGRSFVLHPLQAASATAVAGELNQMFATEGGRTFRALPVERLSAVLLIAADRSRLERARAWLSRLDQGGRDQRRVHVYPVQNRDAQEIARALQDIIGSLSGLQPAPTGGTEPAVAPALGDAAMITGRIDAAAAAMGEETQPSPEVQPVDPSANAAGTAGRPAISADASTNSLVVIASEEDYRVIEKAIRRLDIMPAQVMIEATIVEVSLNYKLRHGIRWFFESGNHALQLTDGTAGATPAVAPGFNYVFSVADARLVVSALEGITSVKVVSSPALTVLDNQTATLKVGDQVPIAVRSARGVTDPDAPIVNEIQLKDTGILLSVRPRVNASGLVQVMISQEISDVVATTTSSIDSPTIRQRAITSSVVVQSGTEIVLGGLIAEQNKATRSGIPILSSIPIIGEAFTSDRALESNRTEMMIILRPVVLRTTFDVKAVTDEIKARLFANRP